MACGNTSAKTCSQKSITRYYNNNLQPLVAGGTLDLVLGSKVVDRGISIDVENQQYVVLKNGVYHIAGDIVFDSSAAGYIEFRVLKDGRYLPCTLRTVSVAADGNVSVHTETDFEVKGCCCNVNHTFTFEVISAGTGTAAGNVVEFCSGIAKIA